jgi:hypothetical protein
VQKRTILLVGEICNSDLLFADFDSKTQWPTSEQMPAGFDWQKIMFSVILGPQALAEAIKSN